MTEPVVSLSEVVKDDAAAVASAGWQDDGGRGVGFACHPGRVESVCDEEEGHNQDHATGNLVDTTQDLISAFIILGYLKKKKRGQGKISGLLHLTSI